MISFKSHLFESANVHPLWGLMHNSAAHSMCSLPLASGGRSNVPRAPVAREIRIPGPGLRHRCNWIAFFRCYPDSLLTDAVCFGSVIHTASTHATHKNRK